MSDLLSKDGIKYIIARVIENANDANDEFLKHPDDDFVQGKRMAYYEILSTIKNELDASNQDLEEFGLDIDIDKEYS